MIRTKGETCADGCHGDAKVKVTTQQIDPHVTSPTSRATTHRQKTKGQGPLQGECLSQGKADLDGNKMAWGLVHVLWYLNTRSDTRFHQFRASKHVSFLFIVKH